MSVGDERSDEHRAADEALMDALTHRLRLTEQMNADEVIESFIVAVAIDGLGLRDRNACRYAYLTRDSGYGPDSAPLHHLEGLVVRAGRWLAEDDEAEAS